MYCYLSVVQEVSSDVELISLVKITFPQISIY